VESPVAGGWTGRERDHGRAIAGRVSATDEARLEIQDRAQRPLLPSHERRQVQLAQGQGPGRLERPQLYALREGKSPRLRSLGANGQRRLGIRSGLVLLQEIRGQSQPLPQEQPLSQYGRLLDSAGSLRFSLFNPFIVSSCNLKLPSLIAPPLTTLNVSRSRHGSTRYLRLTKIHL
jgi:hypothetical protein